AGENPVVNPKGTTLTTDAGGPYAIGDDGTVNLSDTATLSGGTSNATGTITFQLFSDANCQNQVGSDKTATVTHANGTPTYSSGNISVSAAGTYHWKAKYDSGDANNNSVAYTACGAA